MAEDPKKAEDSKAPAPTPAGPRKVKAGDTVTFVKARGERVDATVKAVRDKAGKIDVEIEHQGESMLLTNCPHDPDAKQWESWH